MLCSDILHGIFSEIIQGEKFPGNFSISRSSAVIVKMLPGIPSPGPQQSTPMSISPNLGETWNNLSPMARGQAFFCKFQIHITHKVYASPSSQESPAGLCLQHSAGSPQCSQAPQSFDNTRLPLGQPEGIIKQMYTHSGCSKPWLKEAVVVCFLHLY